MRTVCVCSQIIIHYVNIDHAHCLKWHMGLTKPVEAVCVTA